VKLRQSSVTSGNKPRGLPASRNSVTSRKTWSGKEIVTGPGNSQAHCPSSIALKQLLICGLPCTFLVLYLALALESDLSSAIPTLVSVTAVTVILLLVVLYAGEKETLDWSPGVIILAAAVFRVLFLFHSPRLSDDLYRYLWDGLQLLNGLNPYATSPLTTQLQHPSVQLVLDRVNHPDLVTIYPPAAQFIFAAGTCLSVNFWGLKTVLVVMDLITCALVMRLLSSLGLPRWRAVLYAWHPLPIIEVGASGHIDGAGIFFLFLMLVLLVAPAPNEAADPSSDAAFQPRRAKSFLAFTAGVAFAWAALVKLFPLLYLPGLFLLVKKRYLVLVLMGMVSGLMILTLPFLPHVKNMFVTLRIYVENWEFAGLAFRTVREVTASGHIARLTLTALLLLSATILYAKLWFKRRCLTKMPTGRGLNGSSTDYRICHTDGNYGFTVISTLYAITLVFLFLTPTLHPWYALYLVCFLPFTAGVPGLILSWGVFLTYRVLIPYRLSGLWLEDDYVPVMIWLAVVSASLLLAVTRSLKQRAWPMMKEIAPDPESIRDQAVSQVSRQGFS